VTSSLAEGHAQEANMAQKDEGVVIVLAEALSDREEDGADTRAATGVEVAVTDVEFAFLWYKVYNWARCSGLNAPYWACGK
jgi:hypothetical protein